MATPPVGGPMREDFHADIDALMDTLVATAETCDGMLQEALGALAGSDGAAADAVVARDNTVDAAYEQVQHGVLRLLALQAPVASDLRLLAAILNVNIHVERLGDYATSIAKMTNVVSGLTDEPELAAQLDEMGSLAREVSREAMRSFAAGDVAGARRLPALDDPVDQLNIGIFKRLVRLGSSDEERLQWASHMILVARSLERYGDHAVDIGEQTIFVVSGRTVELSSNDPADA